MSFDFLITILFLIIATLGIVGAFLTRTKRTTPQHSRVKRSDDNISERGSIFLAIFGAVAMVAILGSATMTFMNGPLRNSIFLTNRNIAATQMGIAAQMAVAAAAAQVNAGDCDGDGVIEPLPWRLSSGGDSVPPTGGGFIPMTIGTSKSDPWGSSYGYCVWDHGSKIDDAGCGGPSQKRRKGATSDGLATVAIISSGPDKTFQTMCNDFTDTSPADGQPDMDLVAKAAGSDDLLTVYTYLEAVGASSGLWQIKSGAANTATIGSKDIEVGGDANFAGQVITDSLNSRTGMLAVNDPLQLPDETRFPTCTAALVGALRRYNGNVEICGVTPPSTYAFQAVGGGGGGAAALDDLSDAITNYAKFSMFLGDQSGAANTGTNNTALGYRTLKSNTIGIGNTSIGGNSLTANTTGNNNTAAGIGALNANISGNSNTALGQGTLNGNKTGSDNVAIGSSSLYMSASGSSNVAIGSSALFFNTSSNNVAIGFNALTANTSGGSNTAVGHQALAANTTGGSHTAFGYQALFSNTTGLSNTAVGYQALRANTTGTVNTAIGYQTLATSTGASFNTAIGHQALNKTTTGSQNMAAGLAALYNNTTGSQNTALGVGALNKNTTGAANTAVGYNALLNAQTMYDNTAVGYEALSSIKDGYAYSTAVGYRALATANNGGFNTAIGWKALEQTTTGGANTAYPPGESRLVRRGFARS